MSRKKPVRSLHRNGWVRRGLSEKQRKEGSSVPQRTPATPHPAPSQRTSQPFSTPQTLHN